MTAPSTDPLNVARRAARQARAALRPVLQTPAETAALAALAYIPHKRAALDAEELAAVEAALRAGLTWEKIAAALGYNSRQAASQRWQRLRDRTTRTPPGGQDHGQDDGQDDGQGEVGGGPERAPVDQRQGDRHQARIRTVERSQPKRTSRSKRRR